MVRNGKIMTLAEIGRQTIRVIEDDAVYAVVWINGTEVYMVVDSCAELTVIDRDTARKLGVKGNRVKG